jgi:Domain of unknown function (DUF4340)
MRSFGITLILALMALAASGLAAWQWTGRSFQAVLGVPPKSVGEHLYASFAAAQVKSIDVSQNGVKAKFALEKNGWQASAPWHDRMDPRAAVGIINFTLGMRVEDLSRLEKIQPQQLGLTDGAIEILLKNEQGDVLASYKLGRRTPWLASVEEIKDPVPTVFIQTREPGQKGTVYACTGDITALFKDGLKFLRDHRPLYFNPLQLQQLRIRTAEGEFTLARATAKSPWRVTKPLELPTDSAAMKALIEGMYELQAVNIAERGSVTLEGTRPAASSTEIALSSFGSAAETLLEISPAASATARDAKATVSDRPNSVFELPLKAEQGLLSLADLPLTINELRDHTLTNLYIPSLRGITIQPRNGPEIVIRREPPKPWLAQVGQQVSEANEERLFSLLKAVTEARALSFESDAVTDFTPWGLHQPFLKINFLGKEGQALTISFGNDSKGNYYANRSGSATVMRVDGSLIAAIAVRPYEWRLSRVWSLDRVNLKALERTAAAETPLSLKYCFNPEGWTASRDGRDVSQELDPARANFVLSILEGLKGTRWLSAADEAAAAALLAPSLTFKAFENVVDDVGDRTGFRLRTLQFAPNIAGPNPGFYYGKLDSDPNPFLLDRATFDKLATPVLEAK